MHTITSVKKMAVSPAESKFFSSPHRCTAQFFCVPNMEFYGDSVVVSGRDIECDELTSISSQLRRNASFKMHGPGIATAFVGAGHFCFAAVRLRHPSLFNSGRAVVCGGCAGGGVHAAGRTR